MLPPCADILAVKFGSGLWWGRRTLGTLRLHVAPSPLGFLLRQGFLTSYSVWIPWAVSRPIRSSTGKTMACPWVSVVPLVLGTLGASPGIPSICGHRAPHTAVQSPGPPSQVQETWRLNSQGFFRRTSLGPLCSEDRVHSQCDTACFRAFGVPLSTVRCVTDHLNSEGLKMLIILDASKIYFLFTSIIQTIWRVF